MRINRNGETSRTAAIPMLVRKLLQPIRKIIGYLSDTERVLVGLDVRENTGARP